MARTQADIERLQKVVDANGYVLEDGKLNPAAVLVETLTKRTVSLARALLIHSIATVGESRDVGKALANERNAAAEDDDLIPTLRIV